MMLNITEDKHTLPLILQDFGPNASKLIDKPTHLRAFVTHFKRNKKNVLEQQWHIGTECEVKIFVFI